MHQLIDEIGVQVAVIPSGLALRVDLVTVLSIGVDRADVAGNRAAMDGETADQQTALVLIRLCIQTSLQLEQIAVIAVPSWLPPLLRLGAGSRGAAIVLGHLR